MKLLRNLLVIAFVGLLVGAATARAQAAPTTLDVGLVKIKVTVPSGWKQNEGTPPTFFDEDKKGSIQFLTTPMPMPAATYAIMHKAALDAGKTGVKAGTHIKAEDLKIDGFAGVWTVESAKDPSIRRMQWQAYGHGGYFNFTLASPTDAFEGYLPAYEALLKGIKFVK